jgi:hypothetical protein
LASLRLEGRSNDYPLAADINTRKYTQKHYLLARDIIPDIP